MKPYICTAVILAATLVPCRSAVIWSDVQDIPIPTTFVGVYVDLVTAFNTTAEDLDFDSTDINFIFGGDGIATGPTLLPARTGTGATDTIVSVPFGLLVDDSLNFGPEDFGASQGHIGFGSGQFPSGTSSYFAFKFDATRTGNYSFGWMRATLTNGSAPGTVHEWAYSSNPGETIRVGAIPEPGSLLLAGLGVGLLTARRRR